MVLSEPEGLLGIAIADLETAEASSDPPLTHDLRRLLLLLEAEGVATAHHEPLAQLTIYAVQFRYDADPAPLGLDREAFNRQVKELIRHLPAPAAHHRRTHAHEPRGPAADAVAAGFLAAVGAARPRCCLAKGCPAPAQDVARRILGEDVTQIDYYTERVKRMVGKVLTGNGITRCERGSYSLVGGEAVFAHRSRHRTPISGSIKVRVHRCARGRCECCGAGCCSANSALRLPAGRSRVCRTSHPNASRGRTRDRGSWASSRILMQREVQCAELVKAELRTPALL